MKYVSDFIVTLSTVVGMLIYVIFSLLGIEHTEDTPNPLFSIIIVSVNLYAIAWVFFNEAMQKRVVKRKGKGLYFIVPAIVIFSYFFEQLINPDVGSSSYTKKIFIQWGVHCVAPFYVALYCYRHNCFDILTRNMEVIALIGSIALILNIPKIVLLGVVQLGGGGGHQDIAYSAGVFICTLLTIIFCGLEEYRFKLFCNKFIRTIEIILLPVLVFVTLMSGGRGGTLLMIVGAIACIYMFTRKKARNYVLIVAGVLLVGSVVFSRNADRGLMGMFDRGIGRSFNYFEGGEIDVSAGERDDIHEAALESIKDSPIIGHGLFGGYVDIYKRGGGYSHNVFYDFLIQGGVLYLIIILPIIFIAYRSAYRLIKHDKSKAMLLTYGLYITVMLLFSGTYLICPQFWLFITFSLLSQRESHNLAINKYVV